MEFNLIKTRLPDSNLVHGLNILQLSAPPTATMLSILPFDHLNTKEQDRPFKAYNRTPSTLGSSNYYSPYPQTTYLPSSLGYPQRRGDSMDVRPPPAHMYEQTPHHLMDISQPSSRMSNSIKYEHSDNMHYPMPNSMHQGYGQSEMMGSLHHGMHLPTTIPTTNSPPPTMNKVHVSSSVSPNPPATSPGSVDRNSKSTDNSQDSLSTGPNVHCKVPPKKRALAVPEDLKDNGYWEKRKKNNDSAKRSRESRRMKEDQIAMRVVYLEQENLQLRTEVSLLKGEIDKLRCMLYNS